MQLDDGDIPGPHAHPDLGDLVHAAADERLRRGLGDEHTRVRGVVELFVVDRRQEVTVVELVVDREMEAARQQHRDRDRDAQQAQSRPE